MKVKKLIFIAFICLLSLCPSWAQQQSATKTLPITVNPAGTWHGILADSRAIEWTGVGVKGGIPNRTTICATMAAGSTTDQINAAIQACPAGQVLKFAAGSFTLNPSSNQVIVFNAHSNITLRGAGADQTFFTITGGGGSCHGFGGNICIDSADPLNWILGPNNVADWTAGYAKGTTTITLSSFTNLKVGNPIILDQVDDASDPGNKYVCQSSTTTPPCSLEGNSNNGARLNRDQQQIVQVVSCGTSTPGATCTNGTVTITPPIYALNWGSSHSPQAWWATNPIQGVGIENLSIDSSNTNEPSIRILNCQDCWVSGVRSIKSGRSHVETLTSNRLTVRNNYFYLTQNSVSQSYGLSTYGSSDVLGENNIVQYVTTPVQLNGCTGCVIGYNFIVNPYYEVTGYLIPTIMFHTAGDDLILVEGNVAPTVQGDVFHGSHNTSTMFRNAIAGWAPACYNGTPFSFGSCTNDLIPIGLFSWNRNFNAVGNVLGTTGIQGSYQNGSGFPIYATGQGNTEGSVTVPADPITTSSLMKWCNYDTFTATIKCLASEVPSTIGTYQNPVPGSNNLPASFYYTSIPSWWPSGKAWPPIGPDVTGGNISGVAGHAYTIPAQDCYLNVMHGPSNGVSAVLSFNASTCY